MFIIHFWGQPYYNISLYFLLSPQMVEHVAHLSSLISWQLVCHQIFHHNELSIHFFLCMDNVSRIHISNLSLLLQITQTPLFQYTSSGSALRSIIIALSLISIRCNHLSFWCFHCFECMLWLCRYFLVQYKPCVGIDYVRHILWLI